MEKQSWVNLISKSVKNIEELSKQIDLTEEENIQISDKLDVRITPYYLDLIKKYPILRKTVVPTLNEFKISDEESIDPLDEDEYKKSACVIHKYPDRCLFLITNFCSTNCRYCTRTRIFDKSGHTTGFSKKDIDKGIDYIKNNTNIRDVILSGGDPLTLNNNKLEYILNNIRLIPHVEIIRIGTKVPIVLPSRIDDDLVNMLKKYHPLYMSLHFTHPLEITKECSDACNKLSNVGIVLRSQTVLLKDINDNVNIMKELMHKLLTIRVSPYYIYYPDYIIGTSHFRPSIDTAINIIKELRQSTSGYAVPTLIFDSKYGKIAVGPENIIKNNKKIIRLQSNNGEILELKK